MTVLRYGVNSLVMSAIGILFSNACLLSQGGIGPAVLEKYSFNSDSSKGDPFSLLWEVKGVHGNKAGKGVRAGLNPHTSQKSLAMTFDSKDDMRLFDHDGSQLAAVSSSGEDLARSRP